MKSLKIALGVSLLSLSMFGTSTAHAESCLVADPTNTPLKYRSAPYGKVLGSLPNGTPIYINDWKYDKKGKPWVRAYSHSSNRYLGWVYYNYLSCY